MKWVIVTFFIFSFLLSGIAGYIIWSYPPKIEDSLVVTNVTYVFVSGYFGLAFLFISVHYFVANLLKPKKKLLEQTSSEKKVFWDSVRRGFLLATLLTILIILNVSNLQNILNASLAVGITILAEIYFSSR